MVWSQYVYEATHGNEAYNSDNEHEVNIDEPLHINDWEEVHHEHLRYMWGDTTTVFTRCIYVASHFKICKL